MQLVFISYSTETEHGPIDRALKKLLGIRRLPDDSPNVKPFIVKNDLEYDQYHLKIRQLFSEFRNSRYEISQPIDLPESYR